MFLQYGVAVNVSYVISCLRKQLSRAEFEDSVALHTSLTAANNE